jgi:surface protein
MGVLTSTLQAIFAQTKQKIPMILSVDTTKLSTGSTAADHFKLPLTATGTYNFVVDWGDGNTDTITVWNDAAVDHTYAASGIKTVTIRGVCTEWSFNNTGDRLKLLNVLQWGNTVSTALDFYGCANLTAISATDSPASLSLSNLFRGCTGLNVDLSGLNVSKVLNLSNMFNGATNFANGWLTMCMPNKGVSPGNANNQINTSPATYAGVALAATASQTDANLKLYSSKTSQVYRFGGIGGKLYVSTLSDYQTLSKVRFTTTGTLPTGLSAGVDYYLVRQGDHSSSFVTPNYLISTSPSGTPTIVHTDDGSGTHTVIEQDSADGWVLGVGNLRYYIHGYDNAGVQTDSATGAWYTRWFYREISAANKNVYYVAGKSVYSTPEAAEAETERTDLPAFITASCVLVGRIIQQNNLDISHNTCSVIAGKVGPGSDGIGSWDVEKATTMAGMFSGAKMFDIALAWNAKACINFSTFMYDCKNFNQSINGFQINSLGSLAGISLTQFMRECRNFNNGQVCYKTTGSAPITINLTGAGNCDSMFKEMIGFNQNMDAIDLTTATQVGGFMMHGQSFNNGKAIGDSTAPIQWSVRRASHAQYMFAYNLVFNQDVSAVFEDFVGADLTFSATGGVVTVTRVGHGLSNGASVVILGSSDGVLLPNGTYTIAGVTTDTFTITAGSGTGTGTAELGVRMDFMFLENYLFNQDVSTWDVSTVTDMKNMFELCTAFNNGANTNVNQITGRSGINGWDVSNATTAFYTFRGCTVFNRPLADWDTSSLTDAGGLFYGSAFNQPIPDWDMSGVTRISNMFNATPFNQDIGDWDVSAATNANAMFADNVVFNQDLSKWDLRKCSICTNMFTRARAFNNGANTNVNPVTGRVGINGWSIGTDASVTGVSFATMFSHTSLTMAFNRPLADWDMSKATTTSGMFRCCRSFNQDLSAWNMGNVTNASEMFSDCTVFNTTLADWNVAKVTNFAAMFVRCADFDQDLSKWVVAAATNMYAMFYDCPAFNNGANTNVNPVTGRSGLNGWNVSGVVGTTSVTTGLASLFFECSSFNRPLPDWNVANCKMFRAMFNACTALKQSFGTWNMGNALNVELMFLSDNLNDTGTSTNYDATLIGWAAQTLQPSLFFNGGNSKYGPSGAVARTTLTSAPKSWTITDGGPI